MLLDYATWQEVCMNGPKTAGTATMMARQPMERLGRLGGLGGVMIMPLADEGEVGQRGFTGPPSARDTFPTTVPTFPVFAWPEHCEFFHYEFFTS